jgi:hypothetical protein
MKEEFHARFVVILQILYQKESQNYLNCFQVYLEQMTRSYAKMEESNLE